MPRGLATVLALAVLPAAGCASPRAEATADAATPTDAVRAIDAATPTDAPAPADVAPAPATADASLDTAPAPAASRDAGMADGAGSSTDTGTMGCDAAGICPPPPRYPDDSLRPNRMFITSTDYLPTLGGAAGADAKCNDRARAAGLPGTFVALLSTPTSRVQDRLGSSRGWIRTDYRPFADRASDLFSGRIFHPPLADEFGKLLSPDTGSGAFTGLERDGSPLADVAIDYQTQIPATCPVGIGKAGGGDWLFSFYVAGCPMNEYRLYCFETGRQIAVSPMASRPATVRFAFTSKMAFDPGSGLAGADALCSSEAAAAALPGRYRGLLATTTAPAISRLDLAGPPWARPDQVMLVDSARDISDGLLAPLAVLADGTYITEHTAVWTGALDVTAAGSETCLDWTSRRTQDRGLGGGATLAAQDWITASAPFNAQPDPCDTAGRRVYCFQE